MNLLWEALNPPVIMMVLPSKVGQDQSMRNTLLIGFVCPHFADERLRLA